MCSRSRSVGIVILICCLISHISHFVLTETLLPLLKSTAAFDESDVRIVNVRIFSLALVNGPWENTSFII